MSSKPFIKNLCLKELEEYLIGLGEPKFRAQQVMLWLFNKCVNTFDAMLNISKGIRKRLAEDYQFTDPEIGEVQSSEDGTKKFTIILHDGYKIESVIIPDNNRITLCISTQCGCKRGCSLCATARMGFKRNLTSGEILDQILAANRMIGQGKKVSNLVFMGMGEPMDNLDEVLKALKIIHSDYGFCIGPGRVTISTVGVLEGIDRFAKEGSGEILAISLHASDDSTRRKLIPHANKVSISEILDACRMYAKTSKDKITFEYVMVKGLNCSPDDAKRLVKLLATLPAKINLIPYNNAADNRFEAPDDSEIEAFKEELFKGAAIVTLRKSRGREIQAACGQLCT